MAKSPMFPGTRKRSLEKRAQEVKDPAWKKWFLEVDRRRKELEAKKKSVVVCNYQRDEEERTVIRERSEPVGIKKLVKETAGQLDLRVQDDMEAVRAAWSKVAGRQIADDTAVFSFKGGILTIEVYASVLLQELRQFQSEALLKDLRDIWPARVVLVQLKFKPGKR